MVYALLMQCAWDTLNTFSHNDPKLHATPGALGVLHTHNRRLDLHPHVHMVMLAAALDADHKPWRTKLRRSRLRRTKAAGGSKTGGTQDGGTYLRDAQKPTRQV